MADAQKPFVCTIEVTKDKGFVFKLQNDSGKITQTITMDGTTLTIQVAGEKSTTSVTQTADQIELKVAGENDTSTVTQKADLVSVKCKTFTVDAETMDLKSTKDTTFAASEKYTVTSTKDMSFSSSAKLDLSSTSDMTLSSSAKLAMSATGDASLKGANTTVEANLKVTAKGGVDAVMSAAKVAITGDAKVDVTAPMATLGDTLTTVKGQIVKVEGTLVKLG